MSSPSGNSSVRPSASGMSRCAQMRLASSRLLRPAKTFSLLASLLDIVGSG